MRPTAVILLLVLLFLVSCSDDEGPSMLQSVHLEDAIGIFQVRNDNTFVWYKITPDGTPSELEFQWDSDAGGNSHDFHIRSVKNFLMASSETLRQTYFIDKANGKAYKSGHYFGLNWFDMNSCSASACYYYSDDSIVIVKDYLSSSPEVIRFQSEPAFNFMEDKDGMVTYTNTYGYLHKLDAGSSTPILDDFAFCSWMGYDGYRRVVDSKGDLYRITKDGNEYSHSYEDVSKLGAVVKFPSLSSVLSVGSDVTNKQWIVHDLNTAAEPAVVSMPGTSDGYSVGFSENYLHLFLFLDGAITLTKINATTFEARSVEYVRDHDQIGHVIGVLGDDFDVFRDKDKLLRANPDGSTTILATGEVTTIVSLR